MDHLASSHTVGSSDCPFAAVIKQKGSLSKNMYTSLNKSKLKTRYSSHNEAVSSLTTVYAEAVLNFIPNKSDSKSFEYFSITDNELLLGILIQDTATKTLGTNSSNKLQHCFVNVKT